MSGECDRCGEHCLQCKCDPVLKRRESTPPGFPSYTGKDHDEETFGLYTDMWNGPPALLWFGRSYGDQIHLDYKQVAALIPLLEHFVETGRLP